MSHFTPNPGQANAINANLAHNVCIIAGAGTGKTETLARRYVRILRETPGIHPRHIVVLTFTEKAATEMRARIMYAVHDERLPFTRVDMAEAHIATFHSFAARLALSQSIRLDLDPTEPFCDERIAGDLTNECWELFVAHGWESAFAHALELLRDAVNWDDDNYEMIVAKLIDDVQGLAIGQRALVQAIQQRANTDAVHQALAHALLWNFVQRQTLLSQRGQLDLDDIINIVPHMITQNPALRDEIRYVMVDEYQDTSMAQAQMLEAVTPQHNGRLTNITAVGDPRQAIYVWRQAKVENIVRMRTTSDTPVDLVENHRSYAPILTIANMSLRGYTFAPTPEFDAHVVLEPSAKHQQIVHDCVRIHRYPAIQLEAQAVAQRMQELHEQHHVEYGDMALLLRRRTYIGIYTTELQRAGIPFDRGKSDPFYHRTLVIDAIHVAEAMVNPHNDISLARALVALNVLSDVSLAALRQQHRTLRVWETIQHEQANNSKIADFIGLHHDFAHAQWYLEPAEWLSHLLIRSQQWQRAGNYGQRMLTKLLNDCRALYARDARALIDVLMARIMHEPDSASPELVTDSKAVQIMTVHAAKGLEYAAVFVADAVAFRAEHESRWTFQPGFLLQLQSANKDEISNEMRRQSENEAIALWYVALTRAKRWLMISGYQQQRARKNLFTDLFDYVCDKSLMGVVCSDVEVVRTAHAPTAVAVSGERTAQERPPIAAQRIISLSPTALHEIMLCPRRYRYMRRCGMSDIAEAEPPQGEAISNYVQQLISQYSIPQHTNAASSSETEAPPLESDSYQSAVARTLGTLFHTALELHATQGKDASTERLCLGALQRYARPVPTDVRNELHVLVARYLQSALGQEIPAPHQVEQSLQWQYHTPHAVVEMRCVIDRVNSHQIVDYKTDHDIQDIADRHGDQLRINAFAYTQAATQPQTPTLAIYHARSGQLIPVDNSPAAMAATKARIDHATSLIVTGDYPAKPHPHHCPHCPARPLCPEGRT